MKKVKISIRICGKTATANLLYVDKSGKTHRSVKQVEKGPGDTRAAVEIKALLAGLQALREPVELELSAPAHIGSAVKNGWLDHWAASGGKKYDGKPVKCWELWEQVHEHLQEHKIGGIHG